MDDIDDTAEPEWWENIDAVVLEADNEDQAVIVSDYLYDQYECLGFEFDVDGCDVWCHRHCLSLIDNKIMDKVLEEIKVAAESIALHLLLASVAC